MKTVLLRREVLERISGDGLARYAVPMTNAICSHTGLIVPDVEPSSNGCEDCLRIGGRWLHLRRCMSCGHIGCCDNSPMRHATAHFHASAHPIIQSFEPGEDWLWCYVDEVGFEMPSLIPSPSHP